MYSKGRLIDFVLCYVWPVLGAILLLIGFALAFYLARLQ